jgi:hypothetical protein
MLTQVSIQRLYQVGSKELKVLDEYELEAGADAPMSLDVSPSVC